MKYRTQPPDGPARRAWAIFSVVLGPVSELQYFEEYQGNRTSFWRVRYKDEASGEEVVKLIPAKNLDSVSDEQIQTLRDLTERGRKLLRRAEAMEHEVIRMKRAGATEEPGPLTGDIVYEKRGRKGVPHLHVRKRHPGEQ